MSKNKKIQLQPMLSPENYIRKNSRKLPVFKCTVNSDWNEGKLASILIARQHTNGNVTSCFYLVDLGCLGVKDTLYRFNEDILDFQEFEKEIQEQLPMEEISYDLAHNIIFAAMEFAGEYGFRPHKDFTSVTQYFLAEDNDDIPLIEIDCGDKDGNPLFINNGYESPAQAGKILNQLEKTAGEGNFTFIDSVNDPDGKSLYDYGYNDDYDEDEEYDKVFEEFCKEVNPSEMLEELEKYSGNLFSGTLEREEFLRMRVITDMFAQSFNLFDEEKIDKYYEELETDLGFETLVDDELPNSFFGNIKAKDPAKLVDDYFEINNIDFLLKSDRVEAAIMNFEMQYGISPVAEYLRITKLEIDDKVRERDKVLNRLLDLYPDFFLFHLLKFQIECDKPQTHKTAKEELFELWNKTERHTDYELSKLIIVYENYIFCSSTEENEDLEKLYALEEYLSHALPFEYEETDALLHYIRLVKIGRILKEMEKRSRTL